MFNTADGTVTFHVSEDRGVVAFVIAIHMHPEGTAEGLLGRVFRVFRVLRVFRVFRVFLLSGREED